jgi:hypothetical protein
MFKKSVFLLSLFFTVLGFTTLGRADVVLEGFGNYVYKLDTQNWQPWRPLANGHTPLPVYFFWSHPYVDKPEWEEWWEDIDPVTMKPIQKPQ